MTYEFNVERFYAQFSSIHMLEGWNLDQIESHDQWI